MKRMAIVGTTALGVGALVVLFAAKCAHAETGIQYQTDALGRVVPTQTVFAARGIDTGGAIKAQAEPNVSEATVKFSIDALGRKVWSQTTHPWLQQARRPQTAAIGAIQPEAIAEVFEVPYSTDSLGRKVPNQTVSPLG